MSPLAHDSLPFPPPSELNASYASVPLPSVQSAKDLATTPPSANTLPAAAGVQDLTLQGLTPALPPPAQLMVALAPTP